MQLTPPDSDIEAGMEPRPGQHRQQATPSTCPESCLPTWNSYLIGREEEKVQSMGKRNTDESCTEIKPPVRQPRNADLNQEPIGS